MPQPSAATSAPQTIDLLPLDLRAAVQSINDEARTVEVVFSTGAAVERYDWLRGEKYLEVLSLDPEHVRLDRLNDGAPLLNAHSSWSVSDQIGAVEPQSAKLLKKEARATLRFSRRADVDPIWQDVKDRIVRNVSVGYRVHKFEETAGKAGQPTVRKAIDWEPFEISMVPMGADPGARVRGDQARSQTNPCVVTRAAQEAVNMPEDIKGTGGQPAGAAPTTTETRSEADIRAEAVQAERVRQTQIRQTGRSVGLEDKFVETLIERGDSVEAAGRSMLDELGKRQKQTPTDNAITVTPGEDARDKWLRGAANWLLVRSGYAAIVAKHSGVGEKDMAPGEFRGMSLLDLAKDALVRANVSFRGQDRMGIAGLAFRAPGYQATSDFAVLLENVMHKILQAAYALQPTTWHRWCGTATVTDFRAHNWYRLGALGTLDDVLENGEFKNKAVADAEKASYQVTTKGNIVAISRQTIVNDDLNAFARLTAMLGQAGATSIEAAVYALLGQNAGLGPNQADGNPLFNTAARRNIGTGAALAAAALDADAVLMGNQLDPNSQRIDLRPDVLLVPRGLEGQARVINQSQYDPDAGANKAQLKPNLVQGLFRDIVGTPRLTGTRRYLLADRNIAPVFVVSFLEGVQEPVLESQNGWRIDGVEMKARLDFGVDDVDFRGAVTNAGTT